MEFAGNKGKWFNENLTTVDQYQIQRTLGIGYNSVAYLVIDTDTQQKWALKVSNNETNIDNNNNAIILESEILGQFDHKNIVKMIHFSQTGTFTYKDTFKKTINKTDQIYLVQELCINGEIFEYVAFSGKFSDRVTRYYFKQLIEGLAEIHKKGYAHRDLKPENLFFDKNFDLKIADFGFSCKMSGDNNDLKLQQDCGTQGYTCPEINVKYPYHGELADLFSSSVILFIFNTQRPPFSNALYDDNYYKYICYNRVDEFWDKHKKYNQVDIINEEFKSLLISQFSYKPTQRPSIAEVMSHPWYCDSDVATTEEILAEFNTRKAQINGENEQQVRIISLSISEQNLISETVQEIVVNPNPSLAFQPINATQFRSMCTNEIQCSDEELNKIDCLFAEIDCESQNEKVPVYQAGIFRAGTTYWSLLPIKDFFKACVSIKSLNNKKWKSTQGDLSQGEFFVRVCDDSGDGREGVSLLQIEIRVFKWDKGIVGEFSKVDGNIIEFYELVKQFKEKLPQFVFNKKII